MFRSALTFAIDRSSRTVGVAHGICKAMTCLTLIHLIVQLTRLLSARNNLSTPKEVSSDILVAKLYQIYLFAAIGAEY